MIWSVSSFRLLRETGLHKNTIVIFTSDHGWGNGEKDYVYKNSLWQESTRVPLIVRAPGVSLSWKGMQASGFLIDLYPTLLDLCDTHKHLKNEKGRPLDGFSMKPYLRIRRRGKWKGPDYALTAYKWAQYYDPAFQSYSIASRIGDMCVMRMVKRNSIILPRMIMNGRNLALDPSFSEQQRFRNSSFQ